MEELEDEPFALIGVNSDDSIERAKKAILDNGLNWRSFQNSVEDQASVSSDWCVEGWPTVVVLDGQRKIHYRGHDGHKATEVARELLAQLTEAGQ